VAHAVVPTPGFSDRAWQIAYRLAYRAARLWWRVRRPHHRGAMIAVWLDGRILGVTQSYTDALSWPGGGIHAGEAAKAAALRELHEELGLVVQPDDLRLVCEMTSEWDYRHDHVHIFELCLASPCTLRPDGREITRAVFMRPEEMLAAHTPPFITAYLRERATDSGTVDPR
jgi:8-oxo-dGTP diphosphatase